MRVDIYRRAEPNDRYSYLAVPEGRPLPEEAANTDWEAEGFGIDAGEHGDLLAEYGMAQPFTQIDEKGYAITSLQSQRH